jgi:uncharacterized protein YjeT (DUF2065 family)
MVVFAYAMVIEGMFVVGMPWTLRNQISWSFRNKLRAKIIGGVFVALGILFIVLSFAAYRLPAIA